MKRNRMIHALLAAAMTASLTFPASAAVTAGNSSFGDVTDLATATNADILRLMGVVSGTGGNQFNPTQTMSRAQFCTMLINFMGLGDDAVLHATRTIFTDVTSSHWARAYINLAASTFIGGSAPSDSSEGGSSQTPTGSPLISGVGDGRFLPDETITYAQAITILIRVLGYSSDKVGAVWPDGYLNLAQSIGLTDGLDIDPYSPITRSQTAQLFVNALTCKTGDGKDYYTTLGTAKNNVVLLAVNAETDDGSALGAVRTSDGTYLPDAEGVAPTALVGRRGSLVLNAQNEIVTFVPDDSESVTISLFANADPSYLLETSDKRYTIASDTPVYTPDSSEGKPYSEAYSSLTIGTRVTLFIQRGKVVSIYASTATTSASASAVVVLDNVSRADFQKLTGGVNDYAIIKNNHPITLAQIQPYDVVTYDSISNTLIVSDLRITCKYQGPAPTVKAPQTLEILGTKFQVLESAWDFTKDLTLGQEVSILFTADGKVAAIMPATNDNRSTAIGMVTGETSVEVFLPNGGTMKLQGSNSKLGNVNAVCTISASDQNTLHASRLYGRPAAGDFDPTALTFGNLTVLPSVRIFEQTKDGAMVPISITSLGATPIRSEDIASYHQNTSGYVDVIILESVTGDAYTYGILRQSYENPDGDENKGNKIFSLENGSGGISNITTGFVYPQNSFGGAVVGSDGRIASIIELRELKNVSAADFFEHSGIYYVEVDGKNYQVAGDVECYNPTVETWYTQESGTDRVKACLANYKTMTLYIDPIGQKVRIITVQ